VQRVEQFGAAINSAAKQVAKDREQVQQLSAQIQDVIVKCRDLLAAVNSPPVFTPVYDGMPELVQPGQDYDPT
jgi:hypothetical protein